MARVLVQMGHVPRRRGATGAHREQEFNWALAPRIRDRLVARGHTVKVIDAVTSTDGTTRDTVAHQGRGWDAFIALHVDGAALPGASVGYPDDDGAALAWLWKEAHSRHYRGPDGRPGPWRGDNYTDNLARYYMWTRTTEIPHRFLAEHGTSPHDLAWLFTHLDECADAHTWAIGELLGHPNRTPLHPFEEDDMIILVADSEATDGTANIYLTNGYRKRQLVGADVVNTWIDTGLVERGGSGWKGAFVLPADELARIPTVSR